MSNDMNTDILYKENIKKFFDDFADTWDDRFMGTKASIYFKLKRLKMIERFLCGDYSTMLEAGCGSGYHILHLLKRGQKGVAFDISEKMIGKAEIIKRDKFPYLNIEFKIDDGENLSLPPNSYDRIIFVGYLIHLQDPQKAAKELYRVLKPGGRMVGLISNRWSPWISLGIRKAVSKDYGVLPKDQEFSPPDVRLMLEKEGFKNIKLVMFNSLPGMLPDWAYYPGRLFNLIFSIWPVSLLGFHIAAIAEKEI